MRPSFALGAGEPAVSLAWKPPGIPDCCPVRGRRRQRRRAVLGAGRPNSAAAQAKARPRSVGRVRSLSACGYCRLRAVSSPAMSAVDRVQERRRGGCAGQVTIAITRLFRTRRSHAGWDARRPRSRRVCMTRLMLTKDLLIAPRANASLGATRAAFGAFPDHDVAPGLRWTRVSRGRWDWAVFVVGVGGVMVVGGGGRAAGASATTTVTLRCAGRDRRTVSGRAAASY